jgi:ParB family chromosome partitioning protein
VQRRVAAGVLSAGHARALLGLTDPAAQERLAQRITAEGLSVRAVEEIVALGDESGSVPAARRRVQRTPSPRASELAVVLSDHFETRVRVDQGRSKGKITIEFATAEDLERIVQAMQINRSVDLST